MLLENKALIFWMSGSHYEVRMHYLGLFLFTDLMVIYSRAATGNLPDKRYPVAHQFLKRPCNVLRAC
jgi:hypothetical protein